jgi:TonB-dependent SusC/RagA subfamily outer membrane receptor
MDDVESVTVLKGPNAAALYGQRADAGVVVITTKKAKKKKGNGLEVSHSFTFDKVYVLPEYQNEYAGGSYPDMNKFTWKTGMPAYWQALDGKYFHTYDDDASWGPRMAGQEYIPWYAWYPWNRLYRKNSQLDSAAKKYPPVL